MNTMGVGHKPIRVKQKRCVQEPNKGHCNTTHRYDIVSKGKRYLLCDLKKNKVLKKRKYATKKIANAAKKVKELEHKWNSQFKIDKINWTYSQIKKAETLLNRIEKAQKFLKEVEATS